MSKINHLNGCEVIVSEYLPVNKVQTRKHRKKRINKKWLKLYGYTIKDYTSYVVDGKICMHPLLFKKMEKYIITIDTEVFKSV